MWRLWDLPSCVFFLPPSPTCPKRPEGRTTAARWAHALQCAHTSWRAALEKRRGLRGRTRSPRCRCSPRRWRTASRGHSTRARRWSAGGGCASRAWRPLVRATCGRIHPRERRTGLAAPPTFSTCRKMLGVTRAAQRTQAGMHSLRRRANAGEYNVEHPVALVPQTVSREAGQVWLQCGKPGPAVGQPRETLGHAKLALAWPTSALDRKMDINRAKPCLGPVFLHFAGVFSHTSRVYPPHLRGR